LLYFNCIKNHNLCLEELLSLATSLNPDAGLVSDRTPIIMKAKNGTVVEVFEWKSAKAIEQAHTHPVVLKLWEEYAAVSEYVPVGTLEEVNNLFSEFTPFE
jgi:hypothetical protein